MSLMFFENDNDYTDTIVNVLARQCVEDGKFKSARNLYELTEVIYSNFFLFIVIILKIILKFALHKFSISNFSSEL